jgi:antitoxin (DNA-binding transcriptional repressor) of toxin-antitoxin stability system
MARLVATHTLRTRLSDYVSRAAASESFVVLRRGRGIALLEGHAAAALLRGRPTPALRLSRELAHILELARREPLAITWYGTPAALLAPLPPDWSPQEPEA